MKKILFSLILWWAILLAGCGTTTTNTSTWTWTTAQTATTDLQKFASCIKDKWAIFYGTTRCSHCNDQKAKFGDAVEFLPFVDCDKNSGTCNTAQIKWYPTWVFVDWTRVEWAQELATLWAKTWCTPPQA